MIEKKLMYKIWAIIMFNLIAGYLPLVYIAYKIVVTFQRENFANLNFEAHHL